MRIVYGNFLGELIDWKLLKAIIDANKIITGLSKFSQRLEMG
jgi:hypothetical protein